MSNGAQSWRTPHGSAASSVEPSGSAKQVPLTCTGHTRPVNDLCFSSFVPTGDYFLISACKDGVPILRKGSTGDWVGSFKGHKGAVWATRITPNASISVTGSADFTAKVRCILLYLFVLSSVDVAHLFLNCSIGTRKVWDNVTGQPVVSFDHGHIVKTVDVSGKRFLSAQGGNENQKTRHGVSNNADDGRYVLTGGNEKQLRLFDNRSGTPTQAILTLAGNSNEVRTCVLDATHGLVFNGDGREMRVWDLRSGGTQVSSRIFEQDVTGLKFSPARRFVVVTAGKRVFFYNAVTASLERQFEVSIDASCAALHPEEIRFVVGGTSDLWVREYDFNTGAELEVFKGHHGPVHCTSFSPDGQLYATGSEDGTVRLWQTYPGTTYGLWQAL
ncbi:hypothetical protein HDU83_004084 [Entophlyctis luteolus]|nr:hypothetical protein HDU83_004084 [Entophlyctis luteolus]